MKKTRRIRLVVEIVGAAFCLLILTLAMPVVLANVVFRTELGPIGLSAAAATMVLGRYGMRSRIYPTASG